MQVSVIMKSECNSWEWRFKAREGNKRRWHNIVSFWFNLHKVDINNFRDAFLVICFMCHTCHVPSETQTEQNKITREMTGEEYVNSRRSVFVRIVENGGSKRRKILLTDLKMNSGIRRF